MPLLLKHDPGMNGTCSLQGAGRQPQGPMVDKKNSKIHCAMIPIVSAILLWDATACLAVNAWQLQC